ncbi:unannotated protein [freshwater metagenome]|uniref:Unannotated protein n=1 Tax=freshwater metagenome TaxID=449393 RepID=A0A6J6SJF9_9ZZZZ
MSYPADLPSGQSNDINVRLDTDRGQVTLNYHNNESTWAGTVGFTYSQHVNWPAGVTAYSVRWVQVAGTNYHWEGDLACRIDTDGDASTLDVPRAVTKIAGFRTGTVTVAKGRSVTPDAIAISQAGTAPVELQRLTPLGWAVVSELSDTDGASSVAFPTQRKRGTFSYRLAAVGTGTVTGAVSPTLVVRVR